jgi:biopolymer transport protein TolR
MAMSAGGSKGGPSADINMTPMIDILLVLLIIFMVVQQGLQRGLSVQVPPIEAEASTAQSIDQIVLEVLPGGNFLLNTMPLTQANLQQTLTDVYAPRPRKVIFVRGREDATYGEVAWAVDVARASGIDVVGLVPRA